MASHYPGLTIDEALRTLELVGNGVSQLDMVMKVKSERSKDFIKGELERKFYDGKPRMPVLGYYLAAAFPTDAFSGLVSGMRQYSALRVIRNSDAASASFLSVYANREDVTVFEVAIFKAGGDPTTKDAKPLLCIGLSNVRINSVTLLGGGVAGGGPIEIIEFGFRDIQVDSAPQTSEGAKDGGRQFRDSWGERGQ
jgi:type VI protein secretion system component Hcp